MDYEALMRVAIEEATIAQQHLDVPVGAVIVNNHGEIVARGHNQRELNKDPLAHAEIVAINNLNKTDWRLEDLTLIVTLEPCAMCASAIQQARIKTLVFGAWDPKAGAAGSLYDIVRDRRLGKPIEVIPEVLKEECEAQLNQFFETRRTSGSK